MSSLAQKAQWWALDYLYAVRWQAVGLISKDRAADFASGSERPVVVIPGIWESWHFLRPLVVPLHDRGHPVHVLTALQRNGRPVLDGATIVAEYLELNDLHDVVIVAHSKGGLIGKYAMVLPQSAKRIVEMVAVNSPFSGSRYAPYLLLPSLRAFSPRDATTVLLGKELDVNARITSVYSEFDPHIPEGSELVGAANIEVPTGGHFRILGDPATIRLVLDAVGDR